MIELVFSACLAVFPSQCRTVHLTFVDVSLMTCIVFGQMQIAEWVRHNPTWRVHRHWCRPAGKDA
jgi:hypothetical protein